MAILDTKALAGYGNLMAINVQNDVNRMSRRNETYVNNSYFSNDDPFRMDVTIVMDMADKHYMGLKSIIFANPNPIYDSYAFEDQSYVRLTYFEIIKLMKINEKNLKMYYQRPFYESMRELMKLDAFYDLRKANDEYDLFLNGQRKSYSLRMTHRYYTTSEAVKIFYELIHSICLKLKENAFSIP